MKFLCDRCKTRYSIGDERVRGKILKIRCKNCANVITVREGMPDADAAEAAAGGVRRKQTTTAAPTAHVDSPANGGRGNALGAAFASAMTKPPPALEEEWYVSIDGDQSGPFSLAEAQRWVANKTFDAELHCWSEGFDDWLPVDKVSHFRGLRKKPLPAPAPPPLPRVGSGPSRAMVAREEEEPKPLFAATMASLEKNAPAPVRGLGLPMAGTPMTSSTPTRPSATPPGGMPALQARTNGTPAAPTARTQPLAPLAPAAKAPAIKPAPTPQPSLAKRTTTTPGLGKVQGPPLGFDSSELGDSATQIEAAPFADEPRTTAEPIAAAAQRRQSEPVARSTTSPTLDMRSYDGPNDAFLDALAASRDADAASTAPHVPSAAATNDEEPGDLDIGEVSRVVKLADLARPRAAPTRRSGPIPNPSGPANPAMLGRSTGMVPKLGGSSSKLTGGTVPVSLIDAVEVIPGANGVGDPALAGDLGGQPVLVSHRRGMIALLVGAAILLGAAIVTVILVMNKDEGETGLGGQYETDTTRPDDPVAHHTNPIGPGSATVEPPQNPFVPRKRPPQGSGSSKPDLPPVGGDKLKADEIESMANKSNGLTSRCFMRATKGADGILLGDVKKITVTLTITADGAISDVGLSDNHLGDNLGKCLAGFIRGWKFRPSPGGTFRFILAKPEI